MLPSPSPPLVVRTATIESVRRLLNDRLSTDLSVRERHGKDTSYLVANPPDAVAFPQQRKSLQLSGFVPNTKHRLFRSGPGLA
jgi:hypothetical protein